MKNTITKKAFLLFFIPASPTRFPQSVKKYGRYGNFKTAVIRNAQERALVGDGTHDDAEAIAPGLNATAGVNTLYLPV